LSLNLVSAPKPKPSKFYCGDAPSDTHALFYGKNWFGHQISGELNRIITPAYEHTMLEDLMEPDCPAPP
jgi:hypothetical protein